MKMHRIYFRPRGLLAVFLAGTCLCLAACQPTPETEIISQKEDIQDVVSDHSQDVPIQEGVPLREQIGAPEMTSFTVDTGEGMEIIAQDVAVEVPDTDRAGSAKVIRSDFTPQQVQTLVEAFFDGRTPYEIQPMTKEDYLEGIEAYENELARLKQEGGDTEYIASLEGQIQYYRDSMETAPAADTLNITPVDFTWKDSQYSSSKSISGENREGEMSYHFSAGEDESFSVLQLFKCPANQPRPHYFSIEETFEDDPDKAWFSDINCRYTEEEASQMVLDFLTQAGVAADGLTVIKTQPLLSQDDPETGVVAYRVTLGRSVGEMPYTSSKNFIGYVGGDEFQEKNAGAVPYDYEKIVAIVTDDGMMDLTWDNPMALGETLAEAVQLLSFDQIQEIISTQMSYACESYMEATQADTYQAEIGKIALGMMRVQNKDNEAQYTLIPVWDVFTKRSDGILSDSAILTVNAMDGSIIDTGSGY